MAWPIKWTLSIWWLMWKPKGEPAFLPPGWMPLFLDKGPHSLAYQTSNAEVVLTSQSLFTNYFTHYRSCCARPHPARSRSRTEINVSKQGTLGGCRRLNLKQKKKKQIYCNMFNKLEKYPLYFINSSCLSHFGFLLFPPNINWTYFY